MIAKAQIKEHQAELQETFDEFYKACKVAIHPDDNIVNEDVRQHALKCAHVYMSQIQYQMSETLTLCLPTAKPEQRASADPGLRDLDLSGLGISPEQAASFDQIAIKQDIIAREDDAWLEAEQRS
jgi:hypothetical protein